MPKAPESGAPLYRPDIPAYRHAVWIDTIYHEPSFFCRLARLTGNVRHFDTACEIWASHVRVLSSERGPLLTHAFDTGARLIRGDGWGCGQGWALFGMVDTLELLPADHPLGPELLRGFKEYAAAVRKLQDTSGFWHTLMDDRESYLESSTAAFMGAAYTKAMRLGLLERCFTEAAERAWQATLSRIDEEGNFWGVSACTHAAVAPGDDASIYRTLPTGINVWGQGAALRFAAERIRAGKN